MTEFKVTVGVPTRCHVRTALSRAQKDSKAEHPDALLWGATVRDA